MQSLPTWLIAVSGVLGLLLGVALASLVVYLSRHVRKRKGLRTLPKDLELALEHIPLLAVIFDRSLQPVAMNHVAKREPVKLAILQETSWFPSYLRETAMSHGSMKRPSNEDDPFWVHVFALDDGRIVAIIADEHDKHDTEVLRREFITNASLELNTPVAAISLLTEALIQAEGNPEKVHEFGQSLSGEVERLSALTKDIARLSQAQTGWEDADLRILDLNAIAQTTVANHRSLAEAAHVDLAIKDSEVRGAVKVMGNERSLLVAVGNLVENAIKYSGPGTRVGVGVSVNGPLAQLSVTDQGPGIAPDEQEKVFKRFYRVDHSRQRLSGGTGLGLSIARNTARSLRGEITLWSKPGTGSTFTLKLPLLKEESDQ